MTTGTEEDVEVPAMESAREMPKFAHCLINKDAPILKVIIGETEFRMRSITAGENADIMSASRLPFRMEDGTIKADFYEARVVYLTVAAALGANKKIGREGWSLSGEVTPEACSNLADDIVTPLYVEHQKFFRADRFGAVKSGSGDSVVAH